MGKVKHIALAMLIISGCQPKIKTVIQKEYIPVASVPSPPDTVRPTLRIETLTEQEKENDAEVAKGYKISIKQLQQYSSILEAIVDEYRKMSVQSKKDLDLLQKFTQPNVGDESSIPFSTSNPNSEVTFTEVQSEPVFTFQHEYEKWATEQKFKQMEEEIRDINKPNQLNIDDNK